MTHNKRILLTGTSGEAGFELHRQLCMHREHEIAAGIL